MNLPDRVSDLRAPRPLQYVGFTIAAVTAVAADWSLAELCWSTWLAGLLLTWLCIVSGGLQFMVTAPRWQDRISRSVPAQSISHR